MLPDAYSWFFADFLCFTSKVFANCHKIELLGNYWEGALIKGPLQNKNKTPFEDNRREKFKPATI